MPSCRGGRCGVAGRQPRPYSASHPPTSTAAAADSAWRAYRDGRGDGRRRRDGARRNRS